MSLRPATVNFELVWGSLSSIVLRIIKCEKVTKDEWSASFSNVYALCVARPEPLSETLYRETCILLEKRVGEIEVELVEVHADQLLPQYTKHWQVFQKGVTYLHNLYSYMNSQYVKNKRPRDSDMCYGNVGLSTRDHNMEIEELGMDYWRNLIKRLEPRLIACLMREIKNDRMEEDGQQKYLSAVIESFLEVEKLRHKQKRAPPPLYTKIFQEQLLQETQDYYQDWSLEHVAKCSCSEYMAEAHKLRIREIKRAELYYRTSRPEIFNVFQAIIVIKQLDFLNQHVMEMVRQERKTDLRNMFELLSPSNLCEEIQKHFSQNVKEAVTNAMDNLKAGPTAQIEFVEKLVAIRNRVSNFIREVFKDENAFRSSIDKAFNMAINERPQLEKSLVAQTVSSADGKTLRLPRPAELLCKYADSLLRKGPKGLSEGDVEDKLNNVIVLFKYIDDKDLFQKFYQRMMCKRLIFGLTANMDAEEGMINQLKKVCGYEFTSKFHRMFTDIQLATELNHNFLTHLEKEKVHLKFSFHFLVLTQCSWPINPCASDFSLPAELHTCLAQFEKFYSSSFQGRKLRWVHQQSSVEMIICYTDKSYMVTMTSLQAAILLHLDTLNLDLVTLADLEKGTQLKDQELIRVVQSLVEVKLLIQKIDNEQVERRVTDDRKFYIQAAIVRIMKSRRHIKHNMLVKEVLDQSKSRFQPPVTMIKRCIENLIDKAYLERTPNASDEYSYLA